MNKRTWCVYKHIFPNGKIYIGITGKKPEQRWNNGFGYFDNQRMFKDIVLFGWRNIKHEILFNELSEDEAKERERELIRSFGEDGRKKTYNHQFASYGKDYSAWADYVINEQRIKKYKHRFLDLDDQWIKTLQTTIKYTSWDFELNMEGVLVAFIYESFWDLSEPLLINKQFAKYPYKDMTFREINTWLNSNPNFEVEINLVSDLITDRRFKLWKAWEEIKATHNVKEISDYSCKLYDKEVVNTSVVPIKPIKNNIKKLSPCIFPHKSSLIVSRYENYVSIVHEKPQFTIIHQDYYKNIFDDLSCKAYNCGKFNIEYTIFINPSLSIEKNTLLNISRWEKTSRCMYKKYLDHKSIDGYMKESKKSKIICKSQYRKYHIKH